jgi:hypothetical protein
MGLSRKPSRFSYRRFFLVMLLTFILVNPVVLFPSNFTAIVHWLHHDGVTHSGYDFNGTLYLNFPARLLAGVPWTYYLWLLLVKTPVPILVAVIAGSIMLLRDRRTLASCFFLSLGVVQLVDFRFPVQSGCVIHSCCCHFFFWLAVMRCKQSGTA